MRCRLIITNDRAAIARGKQVLGNEADDEVCFSVGQPLVMLDYPQPVAQVVCYVGDLDKQELINCMKLLRKDIDITIVITIRNDIIR